MSYYAHSPRWWQSVCIAVYNHRTSVTNFQHLILVYGMFSLFHTRRRCINGQPETVSFCYSLSLSLWSVSLLRCSPFVAFTSKHRPPVTAPLHTIIIYSLIIASFDNDNYYTCSHSNVNLLGTTGAPPSGGPIKKWLCVKNVS